MDNTAITAENKVVVNISKKRGSSSYVLSEGKDERNTVKKHPLWAISSPEEQMEKFASLPPGFYEPKNEGGQSVCKEVKMSTDDLVNIKNSNTELILSELESFKKLGPSFEKYGFNHKRGYLLCGAPGTGKTSTLNLALKQFVEGGGICLTSQFVDTTVSVLQLLRKLDSTTPIVVLLEDIDTIIKNEGEAEVLSLLDGQFSVTNICFLATTNYPEELDGRIKDRPSRFDRVIKFDWPTHEARKEYLVAKKVCDSEEELTMWCDHTEGFSLAHIREVVIAVKIFNYDFGETILRIKNMAKNVTVNNDRNKKSAGFGSNY